MKKTFKSIRSKILIKANQYILRGDSVHCELCGWCGKRFPRGRCPKCQSLPRTRLIPYSIEYFGLMLDDKKVLHVAPNSSEYRYVKQNFDTEIYDRLDIVNRKTVNLVQDLTNTSIEDSKYDLVIIWHVLEHIPEDQKAISEMKRILKNKGNLLVSVPIHPKGSMETIEDKQTKREDYKEKYGHVDHCRSCGLDYYKRFENLGFKTSTLDTGKLNLEERQKYGLSNSHISWLFTKA